ncbi:LuxR family transcriptional regulator [Candidatus Paracaedimonas acanthamoebae]|nr:LuxR family transcriptional regulator [Candidatus Paracaedimonas acanthamoebae]
MNFVDSHCHLNFDEFSSEVEVIIQRARDQKVSTLLTICTKKEEIKPLQRIAEAYESVFCTVGIHPHEAEETLKNLTLIELSDHLKECTKHSKVIGIGEAGLDFYYEHSPRTLQQNMFEAHIDVATEVNLPLSIHTRDAEKETINLLKKSGGKAKGVIHCFTGSQWLAEEALALGFYISISGIVTFAKAEELRNVVRTIPLNRLLLETDAPFLAPIPHRGKKNEPAMMIYTAEKVAELKNVSLEELAQMTTDNFFQLFSKAKHNEQK